MHRLHRRPTCLVSGSTCLFQERMAPHALSSARTTSSGTLAAILPTNTDVDFSTMLTTRGMRGSRRRSAGGVGGGCWVGGAVIAWCHVGWCARWWVWASTGHGDGKSRCQTER